MAQRLLLNAQGTTNQYGEFSSLVNIAAGENFKITIRFRRLSGNSDMEIFGTNASNSSDFVFETDAIATPIARMAPVTGSQVLFNTSGMYGYDFSQMETYSIERSDGTNVTLSQNGVDSATVSFAGSLSIAFFGRRGAADTIDAPLGIELFEVEKGGVVFHRYNMEGTNNGDSLIIPDQVGTNNITLKNMPDSTSHWESYVDSTPVINIVPSNLTYTITEGDSFTPPVATATDDVDEDVIVSPTGSVDNNTAGAYTLTYNHTDTEGNDADPVVVTVNVLEAGIQLPEIVLVPPTLTYNILVGDTFTPPVATATDDLDADVVLTPIGSVDNSTEGTYTLTYNHTDSNGLDADEVVVTVNVTSSQVLTEMTLDVGAPDGVHHVLLTKGGVGGVEIVFDDSVTFSGGSATITGLNVNAGELLRGFVDSGYTTISDGCGVKGVAE